MRKAGQFNKMVFLSVACWILGCSSSESETAADAGRDVGAPDKGITDQTAPDKGAADEGAPDKGLDTMIPDTMISCEAGTSLYTSTLELDTAHFEFTACTGQGAGHTATFKLMEVRFKDASEKLAEKDRGRMIILSEEQMVLAEGIGPHPLPAGKQLIYSANHHNACDSFHVTFSEIDASYAATSSAMAGCGLVVGDAPERTIDDPGKIWYRFKYPGQDWGDNKAHPTRGHFLFDYL